MIETTITNSHAGLRAIVYTRRCKEGKPRPWCLNRQKWGKRWPGPNAETWNTAAYNGYYATEQAAIDAGRRYVEQKP
jgi:hypothetical protein